MPSRSACFETGWINHRLATALERQGIGARSPQVPVQSQSQCMGIERGFRASTGWHGDGGFSKIIIEVFEPRTPVRSNRDFGAGPQHPAAAHAKGFVFITGEIGSRSEE